MFRFESPYYLFLLFLLLFLFRKRSGGGIPFSSIVPFNKEGSIKKLYFLKIFLGDRGGVLNLLNMFCIFYDYIIDDLVVGAYKKIYIFNYIFFAYLFKIIHYNIYNECYCK